MFTKGFDKYAIAGETITCTVDGFDCTATIHHDEATGAPDVNDEGFWPSLDPNAAGYVLPENFSVELAKAVRAMDAWKNDEWFYCGIAVTVSKDGVELLQKCESALWGIECNYPDSDNAYLLEVANEQLDEALTAARAKLAKLCPPRESFKGASILRDAMKRNPFLQGYVEALFFTEVTPDSEESMQGKDVDDISFSLARQMIRDCKVFGTAHGRDIDSAYESAGHDFWLTRNGHGAGFWDGDWPKEEGERMDATSKAFGSCEIYAGDDGLLYAM